MDTVFFIASKLIDALLRPDTWIVIGLGLIVLALLSQRRRIALSLLLSGSMDRYPPRK